MKNTLLQTENLSIEKHTKLRMFNLVIALILLFAFVAIRIYRLQHHFLETDNNFVIPSENVMGQYARVSYNAQQFWLEKTGVLSIHVNDEEIFQKTALKDGDIVKIGSTLMWFQTVPSMMKRRIIYRQPRRNNSAGASSSLQVTFGSNVKKCDIVMSDPTCPDKDVTKMGDDFGARFMTLMFQPDGYIVMAHSDIPVRLPFREISVEKNSKGVEIPVSDNPSQELITLGSKKIVFSYGKGQEIVEIAVLEPACAASVAAGRKENNPHSIWQAQLVIPNLPASQSSRQAGGQRVSLSKECALTITGDANQQSAGFISSVKQMFSQNFLKLYAAIILVGFISFPLTRKKKAIKYLVFWAVTFWAILGSAIIFGDSQANKVVEEDFLANVNAAIDRGILFLDNNNRIQLKDSEVGIRNSEFGIKKQFLKSEIRNPKSEIRIPNSDLWNAITSKGRDIRKFIAEYNDYIQSDGRLGQDWFLINEKNRKIMGLKRTAVTITNYRNTPKICPRGRFLDRDGKSVAKLRVIESNSNGLKTGSEIWLNFPPQEETLRKDIISFISSPAPISSGQAPMKSGQASAASVATGEADKETLLNIGKKDSRSDSRKNKSSAKAEDVQGKTGLKIAWCDGKLVMDNKGGDQELTWYTKIRVPARGRIYDYPIVRIIRPKMVFSDDYNEGRGVIGDEEITVNQNDNQIKLGNLIVVDAEKCFEISAGNNFPEAGKLRDHLAITKRGGVYYAQNLGTDETEEGKRAEGQEGKMASNLLAPLPPCPLAPSPSSIPNSVFIGGGALMPQEERELQPYDSIRIGDLLMEYIPEGNGLLAGSRENGQRYYPVNLSQTVGYFSYPDMKGNLEKIFDGILSNGEDVVLTIDDDLQRIVIDELKLGLKKAELQLGAAVLLDVETGDILAIASEPSYDQSNRSEIFAAFRTDRVDQRNSPILNRAMHRLYPPGSFFKVVVASAALQNADKMPEVRDFIKRPFSHGSSAYGVVLSPLTPSKYHAYAIHPIKDHDNKTHGGLNISEALAKSCNVYFASLAIQLGYASLNRAYYPPKNPLYTFAEEAYLFNESIDLLPLQIESAKTKFSHSQGAVQKQISDLLDRRAFDVLNPSSSEMPSNKLHPSDLSRVGIGQLDVMITPLEGAFILSTIANDGIRHFPGLVKQIGDVKILPDKGERVMSFEAAQELKTMMKGVVTHGTATYEFKYSKLNDYVAGKTGTPAAIDMADKSHAIFGCIAPIVKQANKPQVALFVIAEYGELASIATVPIARRILERVAIYYGWE
jgi:cell division protein FtsI/penicillin-binding protein 2